MILWIILVNFIVFFKTLRLGYVSDDIPSAKTYKEIKDKKKKIKHWIFGATGNKQLDHLKTIIVHTSVCVAIYYALGQNTISFVTALLFSVNPVNNQVSVWISGRHYAICALMMMLCLISPLLSPLFILTATLSPAALFIPLGFLGTHSWWIALFVPLLWLIRLKKIKRVVKMKRDHEAVAYDRKMSWGKLIVAIKIYGFYFALCLIPFKITFYHSFMQSGAGAGNEIMKKQAFKIDWTFFTGLGLIAFLIYSLWNWTAISWGIFWYSVCITPYLNLFRMSQEVAERYCYVACIGIMFALVNLLFLFS